MATYRILIQDTCPERTARSKAYLEAQGAWVFDTADTAEAKLTLSKQSFHLCLWEASNPAQLSFLSQLRLDRPGCAVVVLSPLNEPSFVVSSMRAGASDFWCVQDGEHELHRVLQQVLARVGEPDIEIDPIDFPVPQFIGRHPKIMEIFQLILSIKDTDSNVLITGESGTGKEVVARAIHDLSPRKKAPWVAVNCGAIPANLLESELFGHMKGAFTGAVQNRIGRFQLASGGTLFLDEISDLTLDLQAKILRAIQHKVFEPVGSPHSLTLNARIIAASNQNLETSVAEKKFREDLFYRLNVIPISIPPLRERKSDIPLLVKAFLERFRTQHGRDVDGISPESMRVLMQYQWPGNIRELENLIERVVILKRDKGPIEIKDLPVQHFRSVNLDRYVCNVALPDDGIDLNEALDDFENELIIQALRKTQGNKNKAANLLNLNRTTLVEKLKRKGLKIAC